jgi:hypothetical protein
VGVHRQSDGGRRDIEVILVKWALVAAVVIGAMVLPGLLNLSPAPARLAEHVPPKPKGPSI